MYRKVSLSSFHNGKAEYCAIFGSGDIEENASVIFFTQTLYTALFRVIRVNEPLMNLHIQYQNSQNQYLIPI